ncbi:phage tail sheath subtilisin-like domain-containing protein [Anaerocolumna chitinilytica]|uniref:Phage portal protein n=1 Tax=Anaerocolumna chitinilytica TaxID=1727145 RepID=A0A7M3S9Z3_9FIRM|nr:phage tail sheath subtilisin-like domain-containing protein [Anaerocolumna chitinilytica]BCK01411.1 phage portal protein [Anaerocolumna chitinilytica]
MGMPSINISFKETAIASMERAERGIVALILKEETVPASNPIAVLSPADIPTGISDFNKKQINLTLMGYVKSPKKVICFFVDDDEADGVNYTEAYNYFAHTSFDYMAIPTVATDGKTQEVATWIKGQRTGGKMCKAVLPNTAADNEGIVNFATASMTDGEETFTTEEYCSRIAGLIAGTPLTISCTYAPLNELVDCSHLTNADMDTAINAGKFIIYFDGEKVKVGRGVNSLVTTNEDKGADFKKIKLVDAMDMIYTDIKMTAQDNYLGKYSNSYDNKCLLMSAISGYFDQLMLDGVLGGYSVGIDIAAQRAYLKGTGVNTDTMNDDEIKAYNTGSQVFLKSTISILDAIEDITLSINI